MTELAILDALNAIFRDVFGNPALTLQRDSVIREIDGCDSARLLSVLLAVEEAFHFELRSAEVDRLRYVGDLVAVIRSRTQESSC